MSQPMEARGFSGVAWGTESANKGSEFGQMLLQIIRDAAAVSTTQEVPAEISTGGDHKEDTQPTNPSAA